MMIGGVDIKWWSIWARRDRKLERFVNRFQWRLKFWFGPPLHEQPPPDNSNSDPPTFRHQAKLRRLQDRPCDAQAIQLKFDPLIPDNTDYKDQLILLYGTIVVIVEGGRDPDETRQNLDRRRRDRLCRIGTLWSFVMAGLLLVSIPTAVTVGIFFLLSLILLSVCGGQINEGFLSCVSRSTSNIKHIARESRPTTILHNTIDVLLIYGGCATWCRCKTVPSVGNTWISLSVPMATFWLDGLLEVMDFAVHTILPWGWVAPRRNLDFAGIYLALDMLYPWSGVLSILLALVVRNVADGDVWTLAWYVLLFQLLTHRALSLQSIYNYFITIPSSNLL